MSFRLADLKKSVRKTREGHRITPARLEGRSSAFQVEWVLSHFEEHLRRPRRELEPDALLDFLGDARLGRGLLATLAQWYRVRPRSFAEVLGPSHPEGRWETPFSEHGLTGPVALRAWLYAAVNESAGGYLDPEGAAFFWEHRARALGLRRAELEQLTVLDRPEEAVLVRTGPRPRAADVMSAYNARAHTTLLRSARELHLRCDAGPALIRSAAQAWAAPLEVDWRLDGSELHLAGKADVFGSWTRHGRRVEMAALELLALPELRVQELRGCLDAGGKPGPFTWKEDTLALLGAGTGASHQPDPYSGIAALAALLRRERAGEAAWGVRRPAHAVAVQGGFSQPHLELRRGDWNLFLRWSGPEGAPASEPFAGKTPVVSVSGCLEAQLTASFPDGLRLGCVPEELLPALAGWLERLPGYSPAANPARSLAA